MTALLRYRLVTLSRSQRWVAPAVLFIVGVGIATWNDNGPLLPLYAICAGVLLVAATWLGMAILNLDDSAQRAIIVVSVGRRRALASQVAAAMLGCGVLTAIGLALPLAVGHHTITPAVLLLGAAAQLGCACTGIGIAMLCCNWMLPRPGYAVLTAMMLVMLAVLIPHASPVNPLLRAMSSENPSTLIILALDVAAVAILLGCGALAHQVAGRRN
ncbi:hypothetical protein EH165_13435 [Nakamurella antarctica]|uniref:ABC-2 family transporter protein n=1 Tax=Nakamurella antarctica TaxID=1902245 RepID=A0A3G8ZZM7_9ACTN|nr:hypothetical protein [Nakamurella antarctica]AZI59001.1 hypothetical protein EH165_13435 [Nakamurella antarctica]